GADLGIQTVDEILGIIHKNNQSDFYTHVEDYLVSILPDSPDVQGGSNSLFVIMVVGVNGTGKTTTVAKLANYYLDQGKKVLLVGCDTYRAAGVEQLAIWANRLNIRLVCNEKSQEPSAVLYDGMAAGKALGSEIIIVDTAGRLHTNKNLMQELAKMERVVKNKFSHYDLSSLITIDANLGQNSFIQAKEFSDYIKLDGAVLTKMDGTAKGGIIFSLYRGLGIPVQFIGIGEDLSDFLSFNREDYVKSLFGRNK
ncbi:MAG TPA: signal recognition particle-docking protein FtsY, partial [Candidatus Marinimicrobia bacterium]|nr:signal recognition particle-docking protein FtsY [Candidatus Neomarinimicrobiota bacterium]